MTDTQLLVTAFGIIAIMFSLLTGILGWLGTRLYNKVDAIPKCIDLLAGRIYEKINAIDTRVVKLETGCEMNHGIERRHSNRDGNERT